MARSRTMEEPRISYDHRCSAGKCESGVCDPDCECDSQFCLVVVTTDMPATRVDPACFEEQCVRCGHAI